MEFDKPQQEEKYMYKFVRVGEKIYVTEPMDVFTSHRDLAREDGVIIELERLKREEPSSVDGGMLYPNATTKEISAESSSFTLGVPVTPEGRIITRDVLQAKLPDYTVTIKE